MWVRKIPAQFPPKFPTIKSCEKSKNSPTSFCRSTGRPLWVCPSHLEAMSGTRAKLSLQTTPSRLQDMEATAMHLGKHNVMSRKNLGELKAGIKVTERESPKRRLQKTADFCRFNPSPGNSSIWRAQETAATTDFRRKQKMFAENRRKPQIGLHHLSSVTFSLALKEEVQIKIWLGWNGTNCKEIWAETRQSEPR